MNKTFYFLMFTGLLSLTTATAKPPLDIVRLREVEELVVRFGDDTGPPRASTEAERIKWEKMMDTRAIEERERQQEIRNQPGMKPYLFELFDQYYFGPPKDPLFPHAGVYPVLKAIAIRTDLEREDVKIIADEIKKILNTPYSLANTDDNGFVYAAIPILKADPSPETEKILIGLLTRADNIDWSRVKVRTARLLASIGSEKSVTHLAEAQKWAEKTGGNDSQWRIEEIEPISQAYNDLKRRLEKEHSLSIHRSVPSGIATENGELQKKGLSSWLNHQGWIVMILMGLIGSGFWLLWRKKAAH